MIWVDGERIARSESHIGYLHRGSEKLCEGEQYAQIITLFDRLDYVANLNGELAICMAVEKLMDIEAPERAEYIRVILCELNPHRQPHDVLRGLWPGRGRDDADSLWLPGA